MSQVINLIRKLYEMADVRSFPPWWTAIVDKKGMFCIHSSLQKYCQLMGKNWRDGGPEERVDKASPFIYIQMMAVHVYVSICASLLVCTSQEVDILTSSNLSSLWCAYICLRTNAGSSLHTKWKIGWNACSVAKMLTFIVPSCKIWHEHRC